MNKDVMVRVKGIQTNDGQEEAIETVTPGQYFEKAGKIYIKYEDRALDQDQATPTTVKLEEGKVTVLRHGAANTQMVFTEGKVSSTPYETPFGTFMLDIVTQKIDITRTPKMLIVSVDYTMDMSGSGPMTSQLSMEVVETKV